MKNILLLGLLSVSVGVPAASFKLDSIDDLTRNSNAIVVGTLIKVVHGISNSENGDKSYTKYVFGDVEVHKLKTREVRQKRRFNLRLPGGIQMDDETPVQRFLESDVENDEDNVGLEDMKGESHIFDMNRDDMVHAMHTNGIGYSISRQSDQPEFIVNGRYLFFIGKNKVTDSVKRTVIRGGEAGVFLVTDTDEVLSYTGQAIRIFNNKIIPTIPTGIGTMQPVVIYSEGGRTETISYSGAKPTIPNSMGLATFLKTVKASL